ncbi:MAG: hypothetical protein ACI3U8_02195 [Candidatus Onthomonas sp.]
MNEIKRLTADDLTGVMLLLDSARTILGEVHEEFFDVLNPDIDRAEISFSFPCSRAKSNAVLTLLYDMKKQLSALGASAGYPGTEKEASNYGG